MSGSRESPSFPEFSEYSEFSEFSEYSEYSEDRNTILSVFCFPFSVFTFPFSYSLITLSSPIPSGCSANSISHIGSSMMRCMARRRGRAPYCTS